MRHERQQASHKGQHGLLHSCAMQTPPKNAGDNQDARDGFLHDTKVLLLVKTGKSLKISSY